MDKEFIAGVDRFKMLITMAILGLPEAVELCGAEDLEKAREYASSGNFEAARHRLELYRSVVNSEIDAVITELDGAEEVLQMLKGAQ